MMQKTFSKADILDLPKEYRRNLINSVGGFKSLALVGTIDREGQTNLSLISSIIHVGANPPLLGMLMRPHVVPRHTIENIEATHHFTINHVREEIYEQAHQTSARYPKEVSEFEATGLTEEFSKAHPAPYVLESSVRMGLKFVERHQIMANATQLIIGEIIELSVPSIGLKEDGFIDLESLGTLTVSGLDSYHKTQTLGRLAYAKAGSKP
ncbi:MAG: flavin reductase [Bacteroidota bacterium]